MNATRSLSRSSPPGDRRQDVIELVRAYRESGDTLARERLVRRHLPLVRSLARRHAHRGELLEDLVQVGCVGLIEAIDRFDPERGASLASYAAPTISGHIRHHLRDRSACLRVPRQVGELRARVGVSRERLTRRLSRPPTVEELAQEAGLGQDEVVRGLEAERALVPVTLPDAEPGAPDPFDAVADRVLLSTGLRALGARERRIVHLRFFAGLSQAEIAGEVGLSQVQVCRLLRSSLARMRAALGAEDPGEAGALEAG